MGNKIDMPDLEERKLRLMRVMWDKQVSQAKESWRTPVVDHYHWSQSPWAPRIFAVVLVLALSALII